MPIESRRIVIALVIGSLAIVPAVLFGFGRNLGGGAIASVNVMLIVSGLALLFGVRSADRAEPR